MVVTRIAPSPTGEMHVGTLRTALFNYLYAKQHDGKFVVRIEDTDRQRYKPEWVEIIWNDLEWCGLAPDEKFTQSEHVERHKELLRALVDSGTAYISREPAKDDASREVEVVRLKNPGKKITFTDLVRGEITFDTTDLGDFVIARSIDEPLYHFAVVVDDADEGVTHVIRGEEHISNTPRQILIQEALGLERPEYAHIPLILAPDRSKLSKRKHRASLENYRSLGVLPEALINYLALLGWNPGTEEEVFTMEELIERFSLDQVQKGGAIFDEARLRWFNTEHLRKKSKDELLALITDREILDTKVIDMLSRSDALFRDLSERLEVLADIDRMDMDGEFDYLTERPSYDPEKLVWKKGTPESARTHLAQIISLLGEVSDFTEEKTKEAVWGYATEAGRGDVLWPMRYALSGRDKSPDPFVLADALGREETLARLQEALSKLSNPS